MEFAQSLYSCAEIEEERGENEIGRIFPSIQYSEQDSYSITQKIATV